MQTEGNRPNGQTISTGDNFDYIRTVVKGKTDPVWFMTEVLGENLFPVQEQLVRDFYQHRYDSSRPQMKRLLLEAGQRSGKTVLASLIGIYEFFTTITIDNPSKHYGLIKDQPIFITCVATSKQLAEDGVYANMLNHIEDNEWFNQWFDLNIKETRIECNDKNVTCQVLGSWMNTVVGRSNICAILDEIDYFEETAGKRGAWAIYEKLKNSTATFGNDGHVVAISSPRSVTGIIKSLVRDGKEDPLTVARTYPTWKMNPNITENALRQEYKYNMSAFWRDFGCQPEIAGGIQFPEGIKLTPMVNVLRTPNYRDKYPVSRVLSIDPAVKNDSFGIACGFRDLNNNIVIDGVHKFTKETGEAYISPSEVSAYIMSVIPRLNINSLVFDTWMFPNIIEDVHVRYNIVAEKHIVDKSSYDMWRGLQEEPGNFRLMIVADDDLQREGDNLVVKSDDTKVPRVDHPFNGSKDLADCVCNCIWFLTMKEQVVQVPRIADLYVW